MYRDIQFEKIAKEFGLSYSYKDEFGLVNLLKDFDLFRKFSSKRITNILEEKTEAYKSNFRVFDFEYRLPSLEEEEIYTQTVFFVQSKKLALPHFYMEPRRFFKQIGRDLGKEDSVVKTFPPFSIKSWSKEQTKNAIPDKLRHYFTTEKDWRIEGVNYFMIIYKKHKTLPTTDLMEFLQKGKEMVDVFSVST